MLLFLIRILNLLIFFYEWLLLFLVTRILFVTVVMVATHMSAIIILSSFYLLSLHILNIWKSSHNYYLLSTTLLSSLRRYFYQLSTLLLLFVIITIVIIFSTSLKSQMWSLFIVLHCHSTIPPRWVRRLLGGRPAQQPLHCTPRPRVSRLLLRLGRQLGGEAFPEGFADFDSGFLHFDFRSAWWGCHGDNFDIVSDW